MPPRKIKTPLLDPDNILILPIAGQSVDRDNPQFATYEVRL